jgi:hypothetical protein
VIIVIANDHQREVTEVQLKKFKEALQALRNQPDGALHRLHRKAQEDALNSQIEEFERDLQEYKERGKE